MSRNDQVHPKVFVHGVSAPDQLHANVDAEPTDRSVNAAPLSPPQRRKSRRKKQRPKIVFNWPMPRQEWVDGKFVEHHEKKDESWVELFIDLIYVVLLSSLANQLEIGKSSVLLFFKIALSFWIICLTRQAIDEYSNRFYCHDLVQKCIYFVYSIAVLIQALAIEYDYMTELQSVELEAADSATSQHTVPLYSSTSVSASVPVVNSIFSVLSPSVASDDDHTPIAGKYELDKDDKDVRYSVAFALSILITRMCLIAMYALVMIRHEDARKQFMFDMFRWSFTVAATIVLLVLNSNGMGGTQLDVIIFAIIVFSELAIWIWSRAFYRRLFKFPVNLEALQTRWGIWVMLVIGESVIQLLHSFHSAEGKDLLPSVVFMGISLLLLFALAMQYFDACHVEWYEHALTKSALAGVSWIWLHVPMTHYLFRLGLWLKDISLAHSSGDLVSPAIRHMFSISLGLVSFLMTIVRMSNSLPDSSVSLVSSVYGSETRTLLVFFFRIAVSIIQIFLGFAGIDKPIDFLISQCILTLITSAIDVINDIYSAELRLKEEDAKEQSYVPIKSLREFPRQWSRLQLVRKESLLEMNLMSDDGHMCTIASSKGTSRESQSHTTTATASLSSEVLQRMFGTPLANSSEGSDPNAGKAEVINIDLKKFVDAPVPRLGRPTHFDAQSFAIARQKSLKKIQMEDMKKPNFISSILNKGRSILASLPEDKKMSEGSLQVSSARSLQGDNSRSMGHGRGIDHNGENPNSYSSHSRVGRIDSQSVSSVSTNRVGHITSRQSSMSRERDKELDSSNGLLFEKQLSGPNASMLVNDAVVGSDDSDKATQLMPRFQTLFSHGMEAEVEGKAKVGSMAGKQNSKSGLIDTQHNGNGNGNSNFNDSDDDGMLDSDREGIVRLHQGYSTSVAFSSSHSTVQTLSEQRTISMDTKL